MVVTVVFDDRIREIGSFRSSRTSTPIRTRPTARKVFLFRSGARGRLGVNVCVRQPGTSAISPAPAIIPAGQLAADVVIQGLAPGTDSVIPPRRIRGQVLARVRGAETI